MKTRIAVLKDFDGVIIGRDIGNILTEGKLYEINSDNGIITIKEIGEHSKVDNYNTKSISDLLVNGQHCTVNNSEAEFINKYKLESLYNKETLDAYEICIDLKSDIIRETNKDKKLKAIELFMNLSDKYNLSFIQSDKLTNE